MSRGALPAALIVGVACTAAPGGGGPTTGSPTTGAPATGLPAGLATGAPSTTTDTGGCFETVEVEWVDADGAEPLDTDGDGLYDQNCSSDEVRFRVCNLPGSGWELAMHLEGAYGGDIEQECFAGYDGVLTCHRFTEGNETGLQQTCRPDAIEYGETTLFDASLEDQITYYLVASMGACWVWGADPSYYASLGCTEL